MTGCARGLDGTSERTRTLCECLLEPMLVVIGQPGSHDAARHAYAEAGWDRCVTPDRGTAL